MVIVSKRLPEWFRNIIGEYFTDIRDYGEEIEAEEGEFLPLYLLDFNDRNYVDPTSIPPQNTIFLTSSEEDFHIDEMRSSGWMHLLILNKYKGSLKTVIRRIKQVYNYLNGQPHHLEGVSMRCEKIYSPLKIEEVADRVLHHYPVSPKLTRIRTVLVETLTNAFFYGAKDEDPSAKFTWNLDFTLTEENAVELCHGTDGEQIFLCVADAGGKLGPETYLHCLHRQGTKGENGLPLGIFDTHGRGLFITRKLSDHFFVTVKKGQRSECLMILEPEAEDHPHKHISFLIA